MRNTKKIFGKKIYKIHYMINGTKLDELKQRLSALGTPEMQQEINDKLKQEKIQKEELARKKIDDQIKIDKEKDNLRLNKKVKPLRLTRDDEPIEDRLNKINAYIGSIGKGILSVGPHVPRKVALESYEGFIKKEAVRLPSINQYDLRLNKGGSFKKTYGYKESDLIKFFLEKTLYKVGFDIVLNEFYYKGCIADIFAVFKGRGFEFEIKSSRQDFLNDKKKTFWQGKPIDKHGTLEAGETMVYKFFFVTPEGMINDSDLPKHSGLITYTIKDDIPSFQIVKEAPALHNDKINDRTGRREARYLTPGEWQTIAKRLSERVQSLQSRYVENKFKMLLKKSELYGNNNLNDQTSNPSQVHPGGCGPISDTRG